MNKHLKAAWCARAGALFLGGIAGLLALPAGAAVDAASLAHFDFHGQARHTLAGLMHGHNALRASQPISGSIITLYAAGNSGYGSASTIGIGYTDSNGNIQAVYYCPSGNQQVYLVASGGNAGNGNNSAIGMSAALGHCNSLPSQVTVDEATTVASVYALDQFLNGGATQPGTSSSNAAGLNNAVATVANLVDLSTGLAQSTLPAGALGTLPTATVNTLANILATCVTSSGPSSSQCSDLFSNAKSSTGATPGNTLQAALNIARNPGNNVAALYNLAGAAGSFQPALGAAPTDWTLGISYSGGSLSRPQGVAVDAAGNVWVTNQRSAAGVNGGQGSVLKLSPTGVQSGPYLDNGAVNAPDGIAVDAGGKVWVANLVSNATVNGGEGSISGFDGNGNSLSGSPFASGGLATPQLVATDASGNVWATNSSSVTELSPLNGYAGTNYPVSVSGFLPSLSGMAIDNPGNIWLADANNAVVVALSAANPAQQLAGSPHAGGGLSTPTGLAFDPSGNVWAPNSSNGVTELVKSSAYSAVNFPANAVNAPGSTNPAAADGAGKIWIANTSIDGTEGVVALNGDGSAVNGTPFTGGNAFVRPPAGLAIDRSGNVWVSGAVGNNVVELVGAAVPVKTPLVGQPVLP